MGALQARLNFRPPSRIRIAPRGIHEPPTPSLFSHRFVNVYLRFFCGFCPCIVKDEQLHDYAARKANVDAAEKALWNEELNLHR